MEADKLIERILDAEKCGDLFENNELMIKQDFRKYSKVIHPDICKEPLADKAMIHLVNLYNQALECLSQGVWQSRHSAIISPKLILRNVKDISAFELGARYVSDDSVVYVFDNGKTAFRNRYLDMYSSMNTFLDRNSEMKVLYKDRIPKITKYLPVISADRSVIMISKQPNEYPMNLFLKAYQDTLTGRDIAWMISRLIDLCCFMKTQNLVMNGFTEENLFICPEHHTIHIYGGLWYTGKIGDRMLGTCKKVYSVMSSKAKTEKICDPLTDIESVRGICSRLITGKDDIPKEMRDWINAGSTDDAIHEYIYWSEMLIKAYGPRKFVKLEVDPREIYRQKR